MTRDRPRFPTALHQQVAELARDFFIGQKSVDTLLIVNSCARGHATPDSDLDLAVLMDISASPQMIQELEAAWLAFRTGQAVIHEFEESGRFTRLHLDLYNKWIREQVEGWLALGDLYRELPLIISVPDIESSQLTEHAARLRTLVDLKLSP